LSNNYLNPSKHQHSEAKMAESNAKKVTEFLKNNPRAKTEELYSQFPDVKQSTLRNYKSKFGSASSTKSDKSPTKTKKTPPAAKTVEKATAKKKGTAAVHQTSKTTKKAGKTPLSQLVFDHMKANPKATNEDLYLAFPDKSKSSLRGYKATYHKQTENPAIKQMNLFKASAQKTALKAKKKIQDTINEKRGQIKSLSKEDLEIKINELEDKISHIYHFLQENLPSSKTLKDTWASKAGPIDKRVKDLEENLMSFIKEKRLRVSSELDEMQHRVSTFISSLKNKKNDKK